MQTKIQKNYRIFLGLIILFLTFALSASFFAYDTKAIYASADSQLSFEKIKTNVSIDSTGNIYGEFEESNADVISAINNGDFVLLDNTDARTDILSKQNNIAGPLANIETEGVLVKFGVNSPVKMLTITATLNGRAIKINDTETDTSTSGETFEQWIFGLPYELSYYNSQTGETKPIVDFTGEVVFTYTYRPYVNGVIGSPVNGSFTFRILSQYDYSNTTVMGEPVNNNHLYNTFDNELYASTEDTIEHFFNYNNFSTSTSTTENTLQYPAVKYDVTKYNLSWTKKLQNNTYYTTSNLTILEDKSAYVVYTTTFGGVSSTQTINIDNVDINPIVEIEFNEIGLYTFSFSYMVRTTGVSYQISSNLAPKIKTLEIFGYQLKYAHNKTGSKELLSTEDKLFADISMKNLTYINTASNNRDLDDLDFFNFSSESVIYDYIPKTNQAPLWFDFLGNLNTAENAQSKIYYIPNTLSLKSCTVATLKSAIADSSTVVSNYTKNKFFSSAGLYFVEINYVRVINSNEKYFTQLFCFEITNSSPEISLIGLDGTPEGKNLTNEQYTNLDVNVNWEKGSPFDAEISARYTLYQYDKTTIQTGYNNSVLNPVDSGNPTTLSRNGVYKINLYYGNSPYTFSTCYLTIDKQAIGGVKYLIQNDSANYDIDITNALSSLPILNEDFKLTYSEKQSGAEVYGEYQAILIIEDNNYVVNSSSNLIQNEGEYYLLNGWKTSDVSSLLTFNTETVFSNQAIYLFHIYDEAGNEFYTYVVLDKTNPVMIFDPSINNSFNIISQDTQLTMGTHKAITLNFDKNNIELNNFKNIFEEPILNDNLFKDFTAGQYLCVELLTKTYQVGTNKSAATNATPNNISSYSINLTNPQNLDEYFYYITLTDKSRIKDMLGVHNTTTSGKVSTLVEYNLDKSQVKMLVNTDQNTEARLYNSSATNQDTVFIQFFRENGGYIVEQLYYDFYPITLDPQSLNYPYSDTPTLSNINLLTGTTTINNEERTQNINLIQVQNPDKLITAPGKYVITRVYAYDSELFESQNDSKRSKQYNFMVDRIKPIEKLNVDYPLSGTTDEFSRNVGNFIKLTLGLSNKVDFKNFLSANQNESGQIILTTDILPIQSTIPFNKYATDADGNVINQDYLIPYNLKIDVYYSTDLNFGSNSNIISTSEKIDGQNFLKVNASQFKRIGYYKFVLSDNTGYIVFGNNNQIVEENKDANNFSFIIEVKKQSPTADFYGTPSSDGTPKILQSLTSGISATVISTRDDQLSLVFYDSQNPYKAKIDYTDVKITRKTKGTNNFENFVTVSFADKDTTGQTVYPASTDLKNLNQVYGLRSVLLNNNNEEVLDTNGNRIYKYTIVIPTQTNSNILYEGEYKIVLHYYGEYEDYWNNSGTINYYYNGENSLNIVLDHTAPNFNLIRLVNLDKYIPTNSSDPNVITKSDIYNYAKSILVNAERKEQVRQFLRTYSFAMPNNFVFLYATNNGFPTSQNFMTYTYSNHDTNSIYFRKYNKYEDSDNSEQSYIISDPEYNDVSKTRFEIANEAYKAYNYFNSTDSDSFANYVLNRGYGEGYYEIIEIDQAGNQTIYTVYVTMPETMLELNLRDSQTLVEYNLNEDNNSLSVDYSTVINDIKNLDAWTYINVYNYTSNQRILLQTFNVTYQTNLTQLIQDLNDLIAYKTQYGITGAKYELEFINRKDVSNTSIFIQRPGQRLQHTIREGLITFEITLPTSTDSTWIKSFSVYEYDKTIGGLRQLHFDLNNKPITGETNFSNVSYSFNVNECFFFLIDNFDRGYNDPIHYIFGIKDIKELTFSGIVDHQQEKDITASETYFTYQELLYEIEVYLGGERIDFTDNENIVVTYNSSNRTRTLTFKKVPNQLLEYEIIVNQTISGISISGIDIDIEPTYLYFTMDTRLPEFELTDQNGNNMNYLINSTGASTSKEIFIDWGEDEGYPVTVSIKYVHNNTTQTRNINRGDSILAEGTYTLSMTNSIGNSISYTFNISQMYAILYDVYSGNKILTPCVENQEFSINEVFEGKVVDLNERMKVYVSIYDFLVIANEQKDLQAVKIFEYVDNTNYTLQIWKISGATSLFYEEYIALIKINSNILTLTNFTMGMEPDVLSKATGIGTSLYNTDVYFHYEPSLRLNIAYANEMLIVDKFIYLELYYNDMYVNKFEESDYQLTENGNYKLYFKDIAGKQYSFATPITSANYYNIDLYNSISFLINGEEPIQNATFNSDVKLNVINQNIYTPNTFAIAVTLNGKTVDAKNYYTKQGWIFSGYGIWNVTMSAKYSGVPIQTTYTFTILSNKEAQTNYSFAKINGYEITKVLKDSETNDITQELKTKYNVNTLTELYLTTENNDYGHYTITVKVKPSEYKPILYYTFEVWLNQFDVDVTSNVPFGGETKGTIKIRLNYYSIYQELGNFRIEISGMAPIEINGENVGKNEISEIQLPKESGDYYIQLWSESGSLISSYKITKLEPLNAVAIIIIVVSVAVVLLLIFLFIKLRTRMKVR